MGETKENNIQQTSEQDLWQEEAAMMHIFSRNRKNNLRTLLSLFKGHYGALAGSVFFFIIKHSPTWVLPIVTANIINAVTDHNGNITKILILNTILMIVFLVQNIPTNYIHTWLYAKTVRTVEKELREALVCKYYGAKDKGFYIKGRAERERDEEDGGYAADQRIDAVSVLSKPVCCILRD